MKKCLLPIMDRIVVKPDKKEERTKGGLYKPDNAKERPRRGVVLKAGPGRHLENGEIAKNQIKEGYVVWFTEFAGHPVNFEGEDLLIMNEADVVAIEAVDKTAAVSPSVILEKKD